ncbi:MAG: TetR/AcrR family transcriptional regulator [Betaproteobacteria bacterium]|nr:TetR/AcrR family transcriptional regulator [Betaproteobacteria bacterium]MDE2124193.1 TetR/AcrR family transcriptional regulator [Betaproteobacteria bacterium]MDE2186934.1 TetR/AcrR family transcriptional regulator [Betaproteobacteria bacterium]MDE2324021.1 TetR/AcrR family transcriptional regulator [Betaproteobacteria bacterium]
MPRKTASNARSAPRPAAAARGVAPSSGETVELPGKGHQTRQAILDCALQMAGRIGLEGLSIGVLADRMDMSKSGVFAHFGSREELQISVIRRYHSLFEADVFYPALDQPRGLPRLHMLFDRWVQQVSREVETGCIYISGAVEFDDRPGPVRDALVLMVQTWHDALLRAVSQAVEVGHLQTNTPAQLLMFELHGLILALHHDSRLLRVHGCVELARHGYRRLIGQYATPTGMKLLQTLCGAGD